MPRKKRDKIVSELEEISLISTVPIRKILSKLNITENRFYDWKKRFGIENRSNANIPSNSWITPEEKQAIIKYALKNPGQGCQRLSYMMIDENVCFVSHQTVYRALKTEGMINSNNGKPSQKGKGFDQPQKPHEQWHTDISYINAGGTFYFLISVLDGYSRMILSWDLRPSMTQDDCQLVIQKAFEAFPGVNPRIISDNGKQFKAKQFQDFVKRGGASQTFTSPYYPQSNGKIERWHKQLKNDAIRPKLPRNETEARKAIEEYIEIYNYSRLHSAIGYVTPYDKYLGIDEQLFSERKNKLALAKVKRKQAWDAKRQTEKAEKLGDHRMEPLSPDSGAA